MANVFDAPTREQFLRHRMFTDERSAEIISELVRMLDERVPVAYRVKDYADGWIIFMTRSEAEAEAKRTGALVQPLYL